MVQILNSNGEMVEPLTYPKDDNAEFREFLWNSVKTWKADTTTMLETMSMEEKLDFLIKMHIDKEYDSMISRLPLPR